MPAAAAAATATAKATTSAASTTTTTATTAAATEGKISAGDFGLERKFQHPKYLFSVQEKTILKIRRNTFKILKIAVFFKIYYDSN